MQEITYEASGSTAFPSAVTTWGFTPDAGTQAGDVFLVQVAYRNGSTYALPPGGGAVVSPRLISDDRQLGVFSWVAPADAPGSVTFDTPVAGTAIVTWVRLRGVDTASPVAASASNDGWPLPTILPSFYVPVPGAFMVAGAAVSSNTNPPRIDPTSHWTERIHSSSVMRSVIATKVNEEYPGQSQTTTITDVNGHGGLNWAAWHLALWPAIDVVDPGDPIGVYADEVIADTPYQWFRFQEESGPAVADWSGNDRHGLLINAPARISGPVDRAVVLNGSTQAVSAGPDILGLGTSVPALSFEVLVKTTDTRQKRYWTGYAREDPPRFAILQNYDAPNQQTLQLEYRSSSAVETTQHIFDVSGLNIWNGEWHHVVFVTDLANDRALLYVDGLLRRTATVTPDGGTFGAWQAAPYIGARDHDIYGLDGPLTVDMAEVAWYDKQLSAERIEVHYNALGSGGDPGDPDDDDLPPGGVVPSTVQTAFPSGTGDIVDDPAIWVNPENREQSVVLGSNKSGPNGGIHVYDLTGSQLSFIQLGETNNVDLRDLRGHPAWDDRVLVVSSNRTHHRIDLLWLNRATRALSSAGTITLGWNEPYGIGMYVSATTGQVHVMVCETGSTLPDRKLEQFRLTRSGNSVTGTLVRSMTTGTQCEGIAGDDKNGYFFVGEEDVALLRYDAESTDPDEVPHIIDTAGGGRLTADIEGVAIAYDREDDKDYLVVSSQGSSSYVVYDLLPPHAYRKTYTVNYTPTNHPVQDTDGIEITRANLGPLWPNGLFVCHDNSPSGSSVSNFKFVDAGLILGTYDEPTPVVVTASQLTAPSGRWANPVTRVMWQHGGAYGAVLPTNQGHYIVPDVVSDMNAVGSLVDSRQDARVDTAYHNGTLYTLAGHGSTTYFRSFDASTGTPIVTEIQVPLTSPDLDAAPIVLHHAENGDLWAAVMQGSEVRVSRSTDGGASWGAAQTVISGAATTGKVSFASVGSTVVLVATDNDGGDTYVRTISDGAGSYAAGAWQSETLPALPAGVVSDDHLTITTGPDGTLYAALKTTGAETASDPLLYLLTRTPAGTWSYQPLEYGPDEHPHPRYTRPSIVRHDNGTLIVAYGTITEPNTAYYRTIDGNGIVSSSRYELASGARYSDSAQLPSNVSHGEYPALLHDRDTGEIRLFPLDAGDEQQSPIGYLGEIPIYTAYYGDQPLMGMHQS